jgi:hypothetical protein
VKTFAYTLPHRPTQRLAEVQGMTADDWQAVYFAYQGFLVQVNLIVAQVKEREARRRFVEDMNA